MKTEVINLQLQQITRLFAEANAITAKTTMTKADELRHSAILAELSMLRAGVSPAELAQARVEEIRGSMGLPKSFVPPKQTRARYEEWRSFIANKDESVEFRTDDQTSGQWGNVVGVTYGGGPASDGTGGGFLIAPQYDRRLFNSLGQYDEVILEENCNTWYSATKAAATTPCLDDVSGSPASFNKSTHTATEAGVTASVDSNTNQVVQALTVPTKAKKVSWKACPEWKSGLIRVSIELDQDSFEPTVDWLEAMFAQRHAIGFGGYAVAQIQAALPSVQNVTSNTSTLDHFDFQHTYKALPPVYRKGAIWLMHDDTRAALTDSLEANARPMIEGPLVFMGKRIVICNSLNAEAPNASAVAVLVNPNYLLCRRVKAGTFVRKYVERYADFGEVGLQSWMAADFATALMDSAFPPCSVLNQHS
jgi:HK97 family phage major capsid protein